jgi:hypothetical protein
MGRTYVRPHTRNGRPVRGHYRSTPAAAGGIGLAGVVGIVIGLYVFFGGNTASPTACTAGQPAVSSAATSSVSPSLSCAPSPASSSAGR